MTTNQWKTDVIIVISVKVEALLEIKRASLNGKSFTSKIQQF